MAIAPSESLDDILVVEREIAELLDRERAKVAQWLDQTKRSIDEATDSDLARLRESATNDRAAAKQKAESDAAAIVDRARSLADRMDSIADDRLQPIVRNAIAAIGREREP